MSASALPFAATMVERGAVPRVSVLRRSFARLARAMTTPLVPDDYIALAPEGAGACRASCADERGPDRRICARPDLSVPVAPPVSAGPA
jgi:hypothetical protein